MITLNLFFNWNLSHGSEKMKLKIEDKVNLGVLWDSVLKMDKKSISISLTCTHIYFSHMRTKVLNNGKEKIHA